MSTVVVSAARTPQGRFGGVLLPLRAVDLGGIAIASALSRGGLPPEQVDEVIFGHVIQGGTGQITSRQAAVLGGLPMSVPATTINKVCLSGTSAIAMAHRAIALGETRFAVAGGMESMSNAPYSLPAGRWGMRMGDATAVDLMEHDGLYCAFDHSLMGATSDRVNAVLGISRAEQDEWAAESQRRAAAAASSGAFAAEIAPVPVPRRKGDPLIVDTDEGVRADATLENLAALRPVFSADGTITAGNASQISDGGAALLLADRTAAEASGLPILAEILSYGQVAGPDTSLHDKPARALEAALRRRGMSFADLDLVEINEAFAGVALWSARLAGLPRDKVNVHGGAVALGHPLGASGARLVVTLIHALRLSGGGIGGVALCGGGGQGDALVLQVDGR
jgi:acetyl-CoA C-acetyltransferase